MIQYYIRGLNPTIYLSVINKITYMIQYYIRGFNLTIYLNSCTNVYIEKCLIVITYYQRI